MQVDAPRTDFCEQRHGIVRWQSGAHNVTKRIASAIADSPEAE